VLRFRRLHDVNAHGATRGEETSGEGGDTGGPT
jgi:hypothetical protein